MNRYEAKVHIKKSEYDRVNRLLSITDLTQMTDTELFQAHANMHANEGIFCAKFNDGSSINFDLCSGTVNYYDDVVWINSDGSTDITLECTFELGDIEVEIEGTMYVVTLIIEEESK